MAYTAATPADLNMRYPEFDAVSDGRIQYWLDDAYNRTVGQEWSATDGPVAQMLAAAHELAMQGLGAGNESDAPAGVTSLRSGALSLTFDAESVRTRDAGGWAATKYGAQFLALLKLTKGGPRVTSGVPIACCGTGVLSGLHPSL